MPDFKAKVALEALRGDKTIQQIATQTKLYSTQVGTWKRSQHELNPAQLVFVDETWARTDMTPLRGWGPRGKRLLAKTPGGHWNTTTFTAGLRQDAIIAPLVLAAP